MNKLRVAEFKRHLLEIADHRELWAVWPDPNAPDGVAFALIVMPDDEREDTPIVAVRVADEAAAGALYELVAPEMRHLNRVIEG